MARAVIVHDETGRDDIAENNPVWQSGMRRCRWTSGNRRSVAKDYRRLKSTLESER